MNTGTDTLKNHLESISKSFGILLKNIEAYISYYIKLVTPYIKYRSSYMGFLKFVSRLKRQGKRYGLVKGTNAVFKFDIRDMVIPSYMYTRHETYSQKDMEMFFRFAKEKCGISASSAKGLFLDIGANIGTTTVHVAKNLGKDLKVVAFEPNKLNYQLLVQNCKLNKCSNVKLCNVALSNTSGTKEIEVFDYNRGKCKLIEDGKSGCHSAKDIKSEVISAFTADEYLPKTGIDGEEVRYIWIDVEGHEACVIDGMMNFLSKYHPPMLLEFTPKKIPLMEASESDFLRMYKNLSSVYDSMIVWGLNDADNFMEMNIKQLKKLFYAGKQQYNLFLYKSR